MKPIRILFLTIITLNLCINFVEAQEKGGCDLCGPASGTAQNIVTGNYSATIGSGCEASGNYSLSVGLYAKTNAVSTIALGRFVRAKATNSIVIGSGVSNTDTRALVNNVSNSLMIGFNSSVPTLFVGASSGFNSTGKVGIGNVTLPQTKLHIKSDADEDAGIILEPTTEQSEAFLQIYNDKHKISVSKNNGMSFLSQNDKIIFDAKTVNMNAKVAINTSSKFTDGYNYALAVSGGILTTEVLVKEVGEWYDFVFDDDYKLLSISELESFIDDNGHLPDIPSEEVVTSEGYNLVEMDGLLLKKIEELTLYTIELNKLVEEQRKIIETLQSK